MTPTKPVPSGRNAWLVILPLCKLLLHLATSSGYGYFRDELYYLACAEHPAWGYVDHPPFSILLLWGMRSLFGASLLALRLLPAIAGAGTVLLTGLITRRLGGGHLAQAMAMLCALISPVFLGVDHYYSMNAFDLLLWPLIAYTLIGVLQSPRQERWLQLGVVLGIGLLNKISVLWVGCGLLVGLVLSRRGRLLGTSGPYLAAAVAFLIFLPNLLWQATHGWPTIEFLRNAAGIKMAATSPWAFLMGQVTAIGPTTLIVWAPGLIYLWVSGAMRPVRPLAWIYVVIFAILALSGSSRVNYLAPAYTWLFAGGALFWERFGHRLRARILAPAMMVLVVLPGLFAMPLGLPILRVERFIRYSEMLGISIPNAEKTEEGPLHQFFADMHGWEELVMTIRDVYDALPPEDRAEAAILTSNYGQAGAIDFFGRRYGLPQAISGHNNYWLWGPRGHSGRVMIVLARNTERLRYLFEESEEVARTSCRYCMPYENDVPVWVCRKPRVSLDEIWPELRRFI